MSQARRENHEPPYGTPGPMDYQHGQVVRLRLTIDPAMATADQLHREVKALSSTGGIADARVMVERAQERFPEDPRFGEWKRVLAPVEVRPGPPADPELIGGDELQRWIRAHALEYSGEWVAVGKNGLVANAKTASDLKAKLVGSVENSVVFRVPET